MKSAQGGLKGLLVVVLASIALMVGTLVASRKNSKDSNPDVQSGKRYQIFDLLFPEPYRTPELVFDGPSNRLEQTVIVPTLESPIPTGKSAIWCASFQLAWNELRDGLAKEPVQIDGAQSIVDQLNRSTVGPEDVDPQGRFSAAGFVKDRILEKIRQGMAERFPNVRLPDFGPDAEAVAYAYLQASLPFDKPFFEFPFEFMDSNGVVSKVRGFGLRRDDGKGSREAFKVRTQIQVLFGGPADHEDVQKDDCFALDLCKTSSPNQIIVARLERKNDLASTLIELQRRINAHPKADHARGFGSGDELRVPTMHWRIDHNFHELEGTDRRFANRALQGLYLSKAFQSVHFKLDRAGVELKSHAGPAAGSSSFVFSLDRPYLIVIRKRGASSPFFVMWVDNAELMVK